MASWLASKLIGGAAGGVTDVVQGIGNVIDQFVETDDEKRVAQVLLAKMAMEPGKAQVELNKIEAAHRTIFVAGWRPWIGWVCGWGLFFYFIPQYIMAAIIWTKACLHMLDTVTITADNIMTVIPPYPATNAGLMELVVALLGMGGIRMAEKLAGKAR